MIKIIVISFGENSEATTSVVKLNYKRAEPTR